MDQIIMFVSQLFNGLKIGSVYALVALGYTMVYGIIRLINFAHGDFIMVGAYVLMLTIPAIVAMGLPAWVAVIPAVLVCVAVGVIVEKAAYKPVREKGNSMTALITAIAMSLLLENGSQAVFGADFQTVPTIFHLPSIAFGKLKLPGDTLLTSSSAWSSWPVCNCSSNSLAKARPCAPFPKTRKPPCSWALM